MEKIADEVRKLAPKEQLPPATESQFDDVELDEEELEAALLEARRRKHFRLEREKYAERILTPDSFPTLTAEDLGRGVAKTPLADGKLFTIDEANREAIKLLCLYFTNDPRFEEAGYSLSKGILLQGPVGVGKSLIMSLLQQNQKQSFLLASCIDIANEFVNQSLDQRKSGMNVLARYFGEIPSPLGGNAYGHRRLGICFDDLGTENVNAVHFGERKNCMEEIIWSRYRNGNFPMTHVTTNLSWEQLKEAYGLRVYDRMREMFNPIAWPVEAKSRRG